MANYSCNYASKILLQQQRLSDEEHGITGNCAGVCAAMCVKKKWEEIDKKNGIDLDCVNWETVAKVYGYGLIIEYSENSSYTAADLLKKLKMGYPVIAKTRSESSDDSHWVVVTGFDGDDKNPTYGDFDCADPVYGTIKNLENSYNFTQFYRGIIYYKK